MKKKKPYVHILLFVVICIIFYYCFQTSFRQILKEVCNTKPHTLVLISLSAILYRIIEGRITYLLAKRHCNDYTYRKGIINAFYSSFYRVISIGSAGGISAIYNLHRNQIPVSEGVGLYFVGYVIHKITILSYGLLVILLRFSWVRRNYDEYRTYFFIGYGIGIAVVIGLILLCMSSFVYQIAQRILSWSKRWLRRYENSIEELSLKLTALQTETKNILTDKRLILELILHNFIKLSSYFIIPYFIFLDTGSLSAADSLSLVSIIYILAAAIPTPSGVGSIEAVYILLIVKFVSQVDAAASMLLFRFATMIVPFIVGGIYIIYTNLCTLRKQKTIPHN